MKNLRKQLRGWGYLLTHQNGELIFKVASLEKAAKIPCGKEMEIVLSGSGVIDIKNVYPSLLSGLKIFFKSGRKIGCKLAALNLEEIKLLVNQCKESLYNPIILTKCFVKAAIHNKKWLLKTLYEQETAMHRDKLTEVLNKVEQEKYVENVRAREAEAARIYFEALRSVLDKSYGFTGRTRQPPRDPVNAALSFGYVWLYGIVAEELWMQGLDLRVSFLHVPWRKRTGLALDLAEEFKQPIIDIVVLTMFKSKIFDMEEDFTRDRGVLLSRKGRSKLLKALYTRLNFQFKLKGETRDLRSWITTQVSKLKDHFLNNVLYEPFMVGDA